LDDNTPTYITYDLDSQIATCLTMGILLCVLGLFLTFFIIYNCEKIKLALDVIDAASDFTA